MNLILRLRPVWGLGLWDVGRRPKVHTISVALALQFSSFVSRYVLGLLLIQEHIQAVLRHFPVVLTQLLPLLEIQLWKPRRSSVVSCSKPYMSYSLNSLKRG